MASGPTRLASGTIFARDFRIVEPLGFGGMGTVYLAEQLSTGRRRALKLMTPTLISEDRSRERFVQEAHVGAKVASDHVVEVVAAGVDEALGLPWLAMELLDGQTLAKVVARRGALPHPEVREVFAQLGHALGAAHDVGLVHRDIKPENVFLALPRRAGVPFTLKVLDFGLAKVLEASSLQSGSTEAMGSPLWMAPEQTGASRVGPETDVWALGLLAYYLLTARHYWRSPNVRGGSLNALLVEIVVEPLVPASERAAEFEIAELLPEGFDEWFAACVDREPAARLGDGRAAAEALAPLLEGELDVEAAAAALAEAAAARPPTLAGPEGDPLAPTAPSDPSLPAPGDEPPVSAEGGLGSVSAAIADTTPSSPLEEGRLGPAEAATPTPAASPRPRTGLVVAVVVLLLLAVAVALGLGVVLGRSSDLPAGGREPIAAAPEPEPGPGAPAPAADGDAAPPPPAAAEGSDGGGAGPTDPSAEASSGLEARDGDAPPRGTAGASREGPGARARRPRDRPLGEANQAAAAIFRAVANECWQGTPEFMPDRQAYSFRVTVVVGPSGGVRTIALPPEIRGTPFAHCLVGRGVRAPFRPEEGGDISFPVRVRR